MNQPMLPDMPDEVIKAARRKHAQALLNSWSNDWDGSTELDELVEHRWAVVTQRNMDAWVNGADTPKDIAEYEQAALLTDGDDVEWIEGVYDLETGEPVYYQRTVTIQVAMSATGEVATSDNTLMWKVGMTDNGDGQPSMMASFGSHDLAAQFISGLPNAEQGIYYIDGPQES